uniref:Uncharacterized protein n=1 Tax=Kalanchoe fedtschenkoi TaxID=63787 RepID=A0A7N0ZWN6_KALFE
MPGGRRCSGEKYDNDDVLYSSASCRSLSEVSYSCGACGYQLNLSSCNRDIPAMCSKYEKSLKKGVVPFLTIDESRFTQREELRCKPFYVSRHSWGLFQRRIKLLCGKCGNYIGFACTGKPAHRSFNGTFSKSVSLSGNGLSDDRIYNIKLGSVQPCTNDHDL